MVGIGSIIAAATGMGAGLGNMLSGLMTNRQAKKLSELSTDEWKQRRDFQEYETPQAYKDYRDLLGLKARQEMPGAQAMREDIAQTQAATLSGTRQLAQGAEGMAGVLAAAQNRKSALRQLGIAASQYQAQAEQNYINAVGQGAQYEDRAYEYNQWLPWQMKQDEVMGMRNYGNQLTTQGWDQMMGASTQGANLFAQQEWYNNMMGQGQQPTPSAPQTPALQMGAPPMGWGQVYNPMTGQYETKSWFSQ